MILNECICVCVCVCVCVNSEIYQDYKNFEKGRKEQYLGFISSEKERSANKIVKMINKMSCKCSAFALYRESVQLMLLIRK